MKILIADDDATSRRMLERVLEQWGYEVTAVDDGNQAFEALTREDHPGLAVLDWVMPGMDGPEVCRKLRAAEGRRPLYLILLTMRDGKEDIVEGLESGANDYICKPFNREELRARVGVGERVIELQNALAERVSELEEAILHVKTLQGLLPICSRCHKIRDDQEVWQNLERYIERHSEARLSHGYCPECLEKELENGSSTL